MRINEIEESQGQQTLYRPLPIILHDSKYPRLITAFSFNYQKRIEKKE